MRDRILGVGGPEGEVDQPAAPDRGARTDRALVTGVPTPLVRGLTFVALTVP
jgi:hypothetical protein